MLATLTDGERLVCADYSRALHEDLTGTAKHVDLWLLIENRGRWDADAPGGLPEPAQAWCRTLRGRFPLMRVAFIARPDRRTGPLRVLAADVRNEPPILARFEVERIEDVAQLDVLRPMVLETGPCFFVCTHGTHDLCCARYGHPIFRAMADLAESDVWQISHVGGCRFAPNLICLPQGAVYGRIDPWDCGPLVRSARRDRLYLPKLRGRCCFSPAIQAAEVLLRRRIGMTRRGALRLVTAQEEPPAHWCVDFEVTGTKRVYRVECSREPAGMATYRNCVADQETPRQRFRLVRCVRINEGG